MTATTDPADGDARESHALDRISLSDAIASVRDQLLEAAARAPEQQDLRFEVGPIQMEFTVELKWEVKGGGKVKAWVLEAGADTARTSGRTHRVAFTLTPRRASGGALLVGNEDLGSLEGFGGAVG